MFCRADRPRVAANRNAAPGVVGMGRSDSQHGARAELLLRTFASNAPPGDALRDPRLNLAIDPANRVPGNVDTHRE